MKGCLLLLESGSGWQWKIRLDRRQTTVVVHPTTKFYKRREQAKAAGKSIATQFNIELVKI